MDTTVQYTISGGGVGIQATIKKASEGSVSGSIDLAAGKAGTLSTRTSDSQGTATLGASHGITTGQLVDVYWAGGVRYGVTVGTVAGTSVPLTDSGAGDVYPAQGTAIIIAPVVTITAVFDGDDAQAVAIQSSQRSHVLFEESDGTDIKAMELLANQPFIFMADSGVDNPFTGDPVGVIKVSNGTATAATFKYVVAINNAA